MTALLYVFQHLSLEDRCRAAVVSKVPLPCIHAGAPAPPTAHLNASQARCSFALQEWHHAAQHPTLWQTLDLRNRQDAAAFLARLRVCAAAVNVSSDSTAYAGSAVHRSAVR